MSARKPPGKKGLTSVAIKGIDLNGFGSAEVIPIAAIQIDITYQRSLRHDLVNRIARAWDIVKAGPILVSERDDGSLWCVDGGHRMAGALQAGEEEIFAHVVHGLTCEEEAELRLARNDRKSDTQFEKFQTRLAMGDPIVEAISETVLQNGTKVNLSPQTYNGINALACLETLYNVDGQGIVLGRTLRFIRESFGSEQLNPTTCSVSMMKASAWFIDRHIDGHEAQWVEMTDRVGTLGIEDIRRKAVSHKAANGGSLWINYYRAMVEIWNFRRQDKSKITWKTQGSITTLGDEYNRPR